MKTPTLNMPFGFFDSGRLTDLGYFVYLILRQSTIQIRPEEESCRGVEKGREYSRRCLHVVLRCKFSVRDIARAMRHIIVMDKTADADDVDFNDAIDGIVLSEDHKRAAAYNDAFRSGRELGFQEGFPHGVARGALLASEVGFYRGFALVWRAALRGETNTNRPTSNRQSTTESASKAERQLASVEKLLRLAEQFPKENTEEDLDRKMLELRSRFKQTCSLLAVNVKECFLSRREQEVF